ncbi:PGPGW domain-containing protein [Nocardioides sp. LS1]|uniref:PGPGW domain-containing protein n=1 Tax=Nocardioides sp. LS1 TaxID=1027620 RepID=UPI000F626993|nr:PGPGW domain-containing protein [Nocardioides sp. LS1]GCD90028.1 hypothetical protein NLS1_20340 [Nocardioides sp. LS1]
MKSAARRVALETLGWILVVAGIAALVLPGPGLLMVFAGLALLSQQYEWAERRVEPVKERALKAAAEGVETVPRIVLSVVFALLLVAAGVLWIWRPAAPGWWPVDESWWLLGGWGTGATQVASGLIALATIVYSVRRFRIRGERPD